jgi:alkylhydroperoxidase family enzyme
VEAVLRDFRSAPIGEPLRATLAFLERMTLEPDRLGPQDAAAVRAAGVAGEALREAIYVAAAFNLITRVADGVGAAPLEERFGRELVLAHGARFLERGYL